MTTERKEEDMIEVGDVGLGDEGGRVSLGTICYVYSPYGIGKIEKVELSSGVHWDTSYVKRRFATTPRTASGRFKTICGKTLTDTGDNRAGWACSRCLKWASNA